MTRRRSRLWRLQSFSCGKLFIFRRTTRELRMQAAADPVGAHSFQSSQPEECVFETSADSSAIVVIAQ